MGIAVKNKETIQEDEERIRRWVRELPDGKRWQFFQQTEQALKDPDTYAALNYLFIAGLHHFYLGKWLRGAINLSVFTVGAILLFTNFTGIGLLLLIGITVIELKDLFYSQLVVQDYNNGVMEEIYHNLTKD